MVGPKDEPSSEQLFGFRCSAPYRRYLDQVLKSVTSDGTRIPEGDYLKLAEYALARIGFERGILAPRRVKPRGTNRHGEPKAASPPPGA